MIGECVIKLIYDEKRIGSLFIKCDTTSLDIVDYMKKLIVNYNTNLANYKNKNSYDFIINFLRGSDKDGNNALSTIRLKEKSLKKYNSIHKSKPFINPRFSDYFVGLIDDDINDTYRMGEYLTDIVEIDLDNKTINIHVFNAYNATNYIKKHQINPSDIVMTDCDIYKLAFNDIDDFCDVLLDVSKTKEKIFKSKSYPNCIYQIKT